MEWKFHVIGAFLAFVGIGLFMPMTVPLAFGSLVTLSFFSMAPDVDHPKSLVRKVAFILLLYLLVAFMILQAATGAFEKVVMISISGFVAYYFYKHLPFTHRGKKSLHRWRYALVSFLGITIAFAAVGVSLVLGLFAIIGYGLHLILDRVWEF
jgi:multisubunit Na+/H+ antiporter MnhB subunit